MSRKSRFRDQRIYNLKIVVTILFFFIIIIGGMLAIDYNRCNVYYGQGSFEIFSVKNSDNDIYHINILDNQININLKYVKRDYKKMTNLLQKIKY
jgi:hypothetical protein